LPELRECNALQSSFETVGVREVWLFRGKVGIDVNDIISVMKFLCPVCKQELRWEIYPSNSDKIVVRLKMVCTHCNIEISLPVAVGAPVVGITMRRPPPTSH